jgi:hypothetical protein
MVYFLSGIGLLVCFLVAALYLRLRPNIQKIGNALDVLASNGYDGAEIRFVHRRSNRSIAFKKEIVGGVPQFLLLVNELNLAPNELASLESLLKSRNLTIEQRKSAKRSKLVSIVVLGHSTRRATEISTEITERVLRLSRFSRFRFEFKGLALRNSEGAYVSSNSF